MSEKFLRSGSTEGCQAKRTHQPSLARPQGTLAFKSIYCICKGLAEPPLLSIPTPASRGHPYLPRSLQSSSLIAMSSTQSTESNVVNHNGHAFVRRRSNFRVAKAERGWHEPYTADMLTTD